MNVFPVEPKFEIGTKGFDDVDDNGNKLDLLNRGEFGKRLTDLVDRTEQPLVIALDGPWGSGKSHFLKLWAGAHKLELGGKAEVIYFDAFEHDFLDDPLVSLIGRLADEAEPRTWGAAAVETLKKSAFPLVKVVSRVGLAVATFGATELAKPAVDVAIAKISETTNEAIDQFWENETSRIKAMQGFRAALEALTKKEGGTTQKIVFIIDELDRCRPDYALQMLEIIKHFFTVPNVHFVLGANLSELENSVKARYGADIQARKYLQKFVMLEMRLPSAGFPRERPDGTVGYYFDAVAANFDISNEAVTSYLEQLGRQNAVTLRDLQRVLTIVALFPKVYNNPDPSERYLNYLMVGVAIISVISSETYLKIRNHTASFEDIVAALNLVKSNENGLPDAWYSFGVCFETNDALVTLGGDAGVITSTRRSFDERQIPNRWRMFDRQLARYFDTFTLPAP